MFIRAAENDTEGEEGGGDQDGRPLPGIRQGTGFNPVNQEEDTQDDQDHGEAETFKGGQQIPGRISPAGPAAAGKTDEKAETDEERDDDLPGDPLEPDGFH